ncbi:hypothetical protein ABZ442_30580 [Streptomyces triculaminicus]
MTATRHRQTIAIHPPAHRHPAYRVAVATARVAVAWRSRGGPGWRC